MVDGGAGGPAAVLRARTDGNKEMRMRRNTLNRCAWIALAAGAFALGVGWTPWRNGPGAALLSPLSSAAARGDRDVSSKPISASRDTALVRAAEAASPAVVSIGAERERVAYVGPRGVFDDWFSPFLGPVPFYQKYREKAPCLGSGIAIDKEGHIVTNQHVVEGASRVFVTLANGKEYEAKILDQDEIRDVAVLKIEAGEVFPATLGDSDDVRLGEWALAIGNPYGVLLADPSPTITAGVVSALNRFFRSAGELPRLYEGMIQTDASINPGNSGGALVNAAGEVIGVNTFIFSESGGSIGLGFAIPINRVKGMVDELRRYGRFRRVRLDFEPIDLTPSIRRLLSLPRVQGVLVYSVETQGPAERAGIEPGDVIVSVDGHPVASSREFLVHFHGKAVGEALDLQIHREGKTSAVSYRVAERRGE